ncbi:MAG: hypothetical protein JRG72_03335 [Deltaproteobacteria bacterium]|nr:hypothetical protein [Deltaproteobacteria bacterium]
MKLSSGSRRKLCRLLILFFIISATGWLIPSLARADNLPVKDPAAAGLKEKPHPVCNLFTVEQLYAAIKDGDEQGLAFDLTGITTLLDGTGIDPTKIYGSIYVGPYPFEGRRTDYEVKRFRITRTGRGAVGALAGNVPVR